MSDPRSRLKPTLPITKYDDTIDSRDIIKRIEDLADSTDGEEQEELKNLNAIKAALETCDEWEDGILLIRDSYFSDHAQDLAADCGLLDEEPKWPYTCIDWDAAATELQYDYSCVKFDGVMYWFRRD